jgi:altronate dehydratase small subunit
MQVKRAIVLHEDDNVATLIDPGAAGERVTLTGAGRGEVTLGEDVPYGHKCATIPLAAGEVVRKYGQVIGRATQAIAVGRHAHVHNIEALRGRGDLEERTL